MKGTGRAQDGIIIHVVVVYSVRCLKRMIGSRTSTGWLTSQLQPVGVDDEVGFGIVRYGNTRRSMSWRRRIGRSLSCLVIQL